MTEDDLSKQAVRFAVKERMNQPHRRDEQWHVTSIREAEFRPPYIPANVRAFILDMIRTDGHAVGDIVVVIWNGERFSLIQEKSAVRDDHDKIRDNAG